jgi:hypothetical protein
VEKPYHRNFRLLRPHGEWPRRGAAQQAEEVSSPHWLSSAGSRRYPTTRSDKHTLHHSKFGSRMSLVRHFRRIQRGFTIPVIPWKRV